MYVHTTVGLCEYPFNLGSLLLIVTGFLRFCMGQMGGSTIEEYSSNYMAHNQISGRFSLNRFARRVYINCYTFGNIQTITRWFKAYLLNKCKAK